MQELYTWNATAVHLECKSCTPGMQQLYTCNAIAVHLECKSCTAGMQELYTWNATAVHLECKNCSQLNLEWDVYDLDHNIYTLSSKILYFKIAIKHVFYTWPLGGVRTGFSIPHEEEQCPAAPIMLQSRPCTICPL